MINSEEISEKEEELFSSVKYIVKNLREKTSIDLCIFCQKVEGDSKSDIQSKDMEYLLRFLEDCINDYQLPLLYHNVIDNDLILSEHESYKLEIPVNDKTSFVYCDKYNASKHDLVRFITFNCNEHINHELESIIRTKFKDENLCVTHFTREKIDRDLEIYKN